MPRHPDASPSSESKLFASKASLQLLTFVFFVSGLSALIHETAWSHYLRLLVGHAAVAQAISIISFMGGLAAGAFLASRYIKHIHRPLVAYALIEFIIGIYALSFHAVFSYSAELFNQTIAPTLGSIGGIHALKLTWSFLLTAPAATLIGMTFPLMSTAFLRVIHDSPEKPLGLLYFSNSIGAALGTLLCGFLLINVYGLPGAMLTAGLMNIAIAIFCYLIHSLSPNNRFHGESAAKNSTRIGKIFIITAFVTGATSFLYEIAWIRLLNLLLGTSDYSFELILSAYITGIALGARWLQSRDLAPGTMIQYLAVIQLIMGALATLSIPTYNIAFSSQEYLIDNLPKNLLGFSLYNISSLLISYAVVLPTTFMAGMTLPLLTAICIRRGAGESAIGLVYGWNTLGAITGVLIGSYFLMPKIGAVQIIFLGAISDVALGISLLAYVSQSIASATVIIPTLIAAGGIQWLYTKTSLDMVRLSSGIYRYGSSSSASDNQLLYYRDGMTATISVLLDKTGRIQLKTNGKTDATAMRYGTAATQDEPTMTLLAAVPMALRPQSRDIANIGFGSGMTTHALLTMPSIRRVDTIELEPAIIEAAREFGKHSRLAYSDPRSNIIIDDARSYFSSTTHKYDLILSEPSNPWVSGVATMFSEQFYRLVRGSLKPDGLFVQWLHLYESNDTIVSSIFNALRKNFNDYLVFNTTDSDILIIASNTPIPATFSDNIFSTHQMADILQRSDILREDDLNIRILGTKSSLDKHLSNEEAPINSDYFPFVSRAAPYAFFTHSSANLIPSLHHNPLRSITPSNGSNTVSGIAEATTSLYFSPSRNPSTAKLIYRYFVEDNHTEMSGNLSLLSDMYYVRSALIECRNDINASILQKALFVTAINSTPYLSAENSRRLWDKLGAIRCPRPHAPNTALWIKLHASIALADFRTLLDAGNSLLAQNIPLTEEESEYLLGGMLLAHDYLGQTDEARKLWRTMHAYLGKRHFPPYLQNVAAKYGGGALRTNLMPPAGR